MFSLGGSLLPSIVADALAVLMPSFPCFKGAVMVPPIIAAVIAAVPSWRTAFRVVAGISIAIMPMALPIHVFVKQSKRAEKRDAAAAAAAAAAAGIDGSEQGLRLSAAQPQAGRLKLTIVSAPPPLVGSPSRVHTVRLHCAHTPRRSRVA